jgi:CRP-like cAMP-binding protein
VSAPEWKRFPLFSELGEAELELLEELVESQSLRAGEVLCMEGSEADGALLLGRGSLLCKSEREGDLGRIEAPLLLGGASLVVLGNRMVSLTAAEPSHVHVLSRTAFHRFQQDAPAAAARLLAAIARELGGALRGAVEALGPPRG